VGQVDRDSGGGGANRGRERGAEVVRRRFDADDRQRSGERTHCPGQLDRGADVDGVGRHGGGRTESLGQGVDLEHPARFAGGCRGVDDDHVVVGRPAGRQVEHVALDDHGANDGSGVGEQVAHHGPHAIVAAVAIADTDHQHVISFARRLFSRGRS